MQYATEFNSILKQKPCTVYFSKIVKNCGKCPVYKLMELFLWNYQCWGKYHTFVKEFREIGKLNLQNQFNLQLVLSYTTIKSNKSQTNEILLHEVILWFNININHTKYMYHRSILQLLLVGRPRSNINILPVPAMLTNMYSILAWLLLETLW